MKTKLDLSVIILTYNEQLHIRRCLENVCPMAKCIYVIDCHSSDATRQICEEFNNVKVIDHEWPGNQAAQLNWALDHLNMETSWVLRLDADEYLSDELKEELQAKLPSMPDDVTGLIFPLRRIFMGREMKHGLPRILLMRAWRHGKACCETRAMDEYMALLEGRSVEMQHWFADHSLLNLEQWTTKHLGYARREAAMLIKQVESQSESGHLSQHARRKRHQKAYYARLPLFWRAFAYFIYRYCFKLGFLDGKEGFLWHFLQGWWYRTIVDAKVYEMKKNGNF